MNLLWTPHNLASLGALRAQVPTVLEFGAWGFKRCATYMLQISFWSRRADAARIPMHPRLSSDCVFQETSARCRAVEPRSGSNVIPRRARPGLAGLRPHTTVVARIQEQPRWKVIERCVSLSARSEVSACAVVDPAGTVPPTACTGVPRA